MRIIAHSTLLAFGTKHPDALGSLEAWYHVAKRARWGSMHDIVAAVPSADPVGSSHVVFNTSGNAYRLVVSVFFPQKTMWVKFIGTHARYHRIEVKEL